MKTEGGQRLFWALLLYKIELEIPTRFAMTALRRHRWNLYLTESEMVARRATCVKVRTCMKNVH